MNRFALQPATSDERLALTFKADPASPAGQAAFGDLYSRYFEPLVNYATYKGGLGWEAPEDVAQSLFVQLAAGIENFDPAKGSWRSWLFCCMHNRIVDRYRQQARQPSYPMDPTDLGLFEEPGTAGAEHEVAGFRQTMDVVIRCLPPKYSRLLMAQMLGISNREMAAMEGLPLATAKSRLRIARQSAARLLAAA